MDRDLLSDVMPELSDTINEDLGFFLESPKSSPVKTVRKTTTVPIIPMTQRLEQEIGRMEISPLSGPSLYISPLTMNYPGTSSPLVGSDHTTTPKSLSNASPLPGGTTSVKSTMSVDMNKGSETMTPDITDMDSFWDNILTNGENPEGRRNSWDASSSNTTTPVDASIVVKKELSKENVSQVKGPEDMTKTLETLDERRSKRLERNRMSARMSRKRKKQLLEQLSDKVNEMMDELSGLRQKCIGMMLKTHAHADSTSSTYRERAALATHFDQAYFENMLPMHTKFLLWLTCHMWKGKSLEEFESHSSVGKNSNGAIDPTDVWKLICNELSLTETQRKKILAHVHSNNTEKSGCELRRMLSCNQFIRSLRYHARQSSERVEMLRKKMNSLLNENQKQVTRKSLRNVSSESLLRQYYKAKWMPKSLDFSTDLELQKVKNILEKPKEQIQPPELNFLLGFLSKQSGCAPKIVRGNERKYSMESTT